MHLRYYLDEHGKRIYTLKVRGCSNPLLPRLRVFPVSLWSSPMPPGRSGLRSTCSHSLQKFSPDGAPTVSAHPARFSPDDKFSAQRVTLKRRFGILPTQQPQKEY